MSTLEQKIAELARRQHGYVRRAQLLRLGLGEEAIRYRVKLGRLLPVYAGVYAVGHKPTSYIDRAAAAVLACGDGAALSHCSAACLWGFLKPWSVPFHVTAPEAHRRQGIVVHRCRSLTRADIRSHQGLRVTSPARTVLDVAPALDERRRRRMVNDAQHTYLQLSALADAIERFPHHPGAKLLGRYVDHPAGPSRSDWEDDFVAYCERYGLPRPVINARVHGYEVDAWFPEHRVVVELDSWRFHKTRDQFEHDRDKDAALLAHDIVTVRITWEHRHAHPAREAARLQAILDQRQRRAA